MAIATWTAIVATAWVTLSMLLGLLIGRVAKYRDQQVLALGQAGGPALRTRTTVWRSTVAADGRFHHRQVA
jgi:hypothetical protein